MIPVPPTVEELRPDFENACGFGHNSGRECQRMTAAAIAAAGTGFAYCMGLKWAQCLAGIIATGLTIDDWAHGLDSYGHQDWSDCGGCVDPVPMHRDERADPGDRR